MLKEILELLEKFGAYLRDLLVFLLEPRRYLSTIQVESNQQTVVRLTVYGVVFTLCEFALARLWAVGLVHTDVFAIVGITVLELGTSLFVLPAIFVVAWVSGYQKPLKIALAFSLTFRFLFLVVPLFFHTWFLASEDYAFALMRGVTLHIYILALFLFLPLAAPVGIRRRAICAFLALLCWTAYQRLIDIVFLPTATPAIRLPDLTLFSDPIGDEVDDAANEIPFETRNSGVDSTIKRIATLAFGPGDTLAYKPSFVDEQLVTLREKWSVVGLSVRSGINAARNRSVAARDSARFRTTRELIDKYRAVSNATEALTDGIDAYIARPTAAAAVSLIKSENAWYDASIALLRAHNDHMSVRIKLRRWGLLTVD